MKILINCIRRETGFLTTFIHSGTKEKEQVYCKKIYKNIEFLPKPLKKNLVNILKKCRFEE